MKNVLLVLGLLIGSVGFSQDTTTFTSWIEGNVVTESKTVIIIEYIDSDDYLIDIYTNCDIINLASSNYTNKGDVLTFYVDENDFNIETVIMTDDKSFVYYKLNKGRKEVIFEK